MSLTLFVFPIHLLAIGLRHGLRLVIWKKDRGSEVVVWARKSSVNLQWVFWCPEDWGLSYDQIDTRFTYSVIDLKELLVISLNKQVLSMIAGESMPILRFGAIIR